MSIDRRKEPSDRHWAGPVSFDRQPKTELLILVILFEDGSENRKAGPSARLPVRLQPIEGNHKKTYQSFRVPARRRSTPPTPRRVNPSKGTIPGSGVGVGVVVIVRLSMPMAADQSMNCR